MGVLEPMDATERQIDDHGDRLQRLEDYRSEVGAQLSANTVQMGALAAKVSDGFARICTQIDEMRAEDKAERAETRLAVQALTTGQADLFSTRDRQRSIGRWAASSARWWWRRW